MSKVYAVVSGFYSDYQVHFVCQTQEIAEELVVKMSAPILRPRHPSDGYRVEDLDFVRNLAEVRRRPRYRVWIDQDGNVEKENVDHLRADWVVGEPPEEAEQQNRGRTDGTFTVYASSYRGHEVALKAARDKLAQLKAEQAEL